MTTASLTSDGIRLTLKDAARRVGIPEMIHFHRLAHRWYLEIHAEAVERGIVPFRIGPHAFDGLDALRTELNVVNGAALAALELLTGLADQEPGRRFEIDVVHADESWKLAEEAARAHGVPVQVHMPSGVDWWTRIRLPAYRVKRYLQQAMPTRSSGSPRPGSVLIIPRMPGHLADLLPVASAIRDEHRHPVRFAVVDRRLCSLIAEAGFDVRGLYTAMPEDRGRLRGAVQRAEASLTQLVEDRPRGERSPEAARRDLLKRRTSLVVQSSLRDAFRTAACVGRLLDEERPSAVVVGNPYTSEGRIAAWAAAARGIKTFSVEHGSIFPDDPCWSLCPADEVFVWGEPSRRALLSCGLEDHRIFVTGGPRHDLLFQRSAENAVGKMVLVAVSGPGDNISLPEHLRFIELLYQAAAQRRDIAWVVKLHRKDRAEYYHPPEGIDGANVRVVPAEYLRDGRQIFELLREARVLITISSTCAVDAMAVGVPVVAVDVWPEGSGIAVEFLRSGACRHVRTADELAAEVARIFDVGPDAAHMEIARRYAADHFVNRGRAAEAVALRIMTHVNAR